MSYILDALRKADAQRSRDPMRGINAQPRGLGDAGPPSRLKPWVFGAGAVGLAAVAWAGWYVAHDREPAQPVAVAPVLPAPPRLPVAPMVTGTPAAVVAMPAPAPAPVVGRAVLPPPVVTSPVVTSPPPPTAAQVAQVQAAPPPGWPPTGGDPRNTSRPMMRGKQLMPPTQNAGPQAMPQQPGVAPQPAIVQQPAPINPPAPVMPAINAAPVQPQAAPLPPPVAAQAPPPAPAAGLPPDAPKLSISGGVYSANRAQRMLIVNGQVFNEGSEITGGVVLEEVKAKTAVLRFRGARYTVTY